MTTSSDSPFADVAQSSGAGMGTTSSGLGSTGGSGSGSSGSSAGLSSVAGAAQEQGGEVLRETGRQARQLLDTSREELRTQAGEQQRKLAGSLSGLGHELRSMSQSSPEQGLAADVADQAAERLESIGTWLEQREPGQLLDEVRRFASQKPGTFLALALGVGVVAGRVTRSIASSEGSEPTGTNGELYDIRDGGHSTSAPLAYPPPVARTGVGGAMGTGVGTDSVLDDDMPDPWVGSPVSGRELP